MNKADRPIALDYRPDEAGPGVPVRSRSKHRLSVVCAAICCTLAVAACGSSSKPKSASTGGAGSMLKLSECMRSHGVSGFPDPSTSQGQNAIGIDGYNFNLPSSLNPQSPAFESAQKTCGNLIAGGSGPPRGFSPVKARQAALAHAECMRQHGVPDFPDPKVSANSQGITASSGGPGIDPRSPAFQKAQKICQPK